jgi:predicted O-methyltransferase YrrM
MKFSQDWFSHNIPNFQTVCTELKKVEHILEIGAFEGRATCWMLENMLTDDGAIRVIDTFKGSEEHVGLDIDAIKNTFMQNVDETRKDTQGVYVYEKPSYEGLADLIVGGCSEDFDFIYVDGSHTAPDVLTDACMAFGLLRKGGIMLFDDYMWMAIPELLHRPKVAIDFFTTIFAEKCVVRMTGYQLAIQKDV